MTDIRKDSNKSSPEEIDNKQRFYDLYNSSPIAHDEVLNNLGLFINRQCLSRMIFMHDMYKNILDVNGVIVEFGVRWGQNLALFQNFRGMYEPFNHTRKIIGFDTFSGFPSVDQKDGRSNVATVGSYSVSDGYEKYLEEVLSYHETESPISHLKKFEIVKGDASVTLEGYLKEYPETIIALAYFDFDIYEPTKKCLELIRGRLGKGSVIGFDELNYQEFPGETIAFDEVLGISNYKIIRSPITPLPSYIIVE
jgi:DNA-directed RNA polymerase subunit N (RpoN/RPB10)